MQFDYSPLTEAPLRPTDAYALAKHEAEYQAQRFVNWLPGTNLACPRIHEVLPLKDVRKEHKEKWEESAVRRLRGWVRPEAVARACLLAAENPDKGQRLRALQYCCADHCTGYRLGRTG